MPLSSMYHRPLQNFSFEQLKLWLEKNWPWKATTGAKALTNAEIAAGTITANEIAAGTITAGQIAAGSITATQLATGAVIADKIYAGAVGASAIAAGAVTADKIAANAIDGKTITGATIRTAASGQRVEMTASGLLGYNSSGTNIFGVTSVVYATGFACSGSVSCASLYCSGTITTETGIQCLGPLYGATTIGCSGQLSCGSISCSGSFGSVSCTALGCTGDISASGDIYTGGSGKGLGGSYLRLGATSLNESQLQAILSHVGV